MEKEVYIFSGLGADERVFQRLDLSCFSVKFVNWLIPEKNDTIENYATKLLDQITTKKPILIGLSFGGIMAIEVSKQIEVEKVIIISSVKSKYEIPFYYRLAGKARLHKILPFQLLKKSNFVSNWFFGAKTTFDKQLLKKILGDTDIVFLKWAIDKIVRWSNITEIKSVYHIHGTNDNILPIFFINCNMIIRYGGHLMILNKAEEINPILRKQIEK